MIALWAAVANAGAWTKDAGEVYAKVGGDVYDAVRFVAPGTAEPSAGQYVSEQLGVYAEAGIVPTGWRAQVAVGLPLGVGHHRAAITDAQGTRDVRASTTRFGDLHVAPQVALHPRLPLALLVDVKVPLYRNGLVGASEPTYRALFPKPGDGQLDVTPMLVAGAAPRGGAFVELGVGYRRRTEAFLGWVTALTFVDAVVAQGKVGLDLGRVLPVATLDAVVSVRDDRYSRQSVALGGAALVDLVPDRLALEPRLTWEPWSRNASRGYGAGLGLSWRR